MLRLVLRCGNKKCKAETLSSDGNDGVLEIDFEEKTMQFFCPVCKTINLINFGSIESLLKSKIRRPKLGTSIY